MEAPEQQAGEDAQEVGCRGEKPCRRPGGDGWRKEEAGGFGEEGFEVDGGEGGLEGVGDVVVAMVRGLGEVDGEEGRGVACC